MDTPLITQDVIRSIVALTEQRDQRSLAQSLLDTVSEMLGGVEGWLVNVTPGNPAGPDCALLLGDELRLPPGLVDLIRLRPAPDGFEQLDYRGHSYLLTQLHDAEHERANLLVLGQGHWPANELQMAQGMIRVYQNFVALLRDSEKDTLTGLFNRRKLELKLKEIAQQGWGRRQRDKALGDYLAIMDLDRFKAVNDNHGHLIGDEVLLVFANLLRRAVRDSDLIFRYGGEEFVALLQEAPNDAIEEILERVRQTVEEHAFPVVGRVTVSIGFARMDDRTSPLEALEQADQALYYAKDNGRNQVREYASLVNQHLLEAVHRDGGIELF
ncbi:GGDEF domain-containing protein [Parasulfuritortus cantonensis]|nr:GGDEF domain-containing protein [Parasulfuritortus cantonensis]